VSTLWLVATPIGNLADLAPRAVEVLDRAALVCCEDTRRTGVLLRHAGIRADRLAVCNDHTEVDRIAEVLDVLAAGGDVAVVSDAGSPGISDPGERIVRAAIDAGHEVSAVPGPSAVVMAVTASGLPTDRFVFDGWLPRRSGQLRTRIESYAQEPRSVILLESNQRLMKSLPVFAEVLPERRLAVCRELTKLHEEIRRGTAAELIAGYGSAKIKGEIVLVLEGCDA